MCFSSRTRNWILLISLSRVVSRLFLIHTLIVISCHLRIFFRNWILWISLSSISPFLNLNIYIVPPDVSGKSDRQHTCMKKMTHVERAARSLFADNFFPYFLIKKKPKNKVPGW